MTWEKMARLLRDRGWLYQQIEWLPLNPRGESNWRLTIEKHNAWGEACQAITAERCTLKAAYAVVLGESEKPRKI